MQEDFKKQPFYYNLNEDFKKAVINLLKKKTIASVYKILEWICWFFAALIILMNYKTFNNTDKLKNSILIFCASGVFIFIALRISEESKKNFDKAKKKVKNEMLSDICKCKKRCTCRTEFKKYMKSKNIDLFKDEK